MPSYDMAISLSGLLSKKWNGVNGVGDTPKAFKTNRAPMVLKISDTPGGPWN